MNNMTIENMREHVINAYPGPFWKLKVQKMDDRQVIAIYKSMIEEKRLDKYLQKKYFKHSAEPKCEQITIFDLLKNEES